MIAITGATGQLGRLVIQSLLAKVPASQIVAAVRSYSLTPEELEAFLMAFKLKNHLFPDESARCFVPEEEEEISEMLLKAQKFAEDIDKSNPVRRIASADLSADPDALES